MRKTTPVRWLVLLVASCLVALAGALPAAAAARAWLGVYTQEITADLREGLDLDGEGVLVARIVDGSPADEAGLRKGDVILAYNSRKLSAPGQLSEWVGESGAGKTVALDISRDGQRRTLSVRLGSRPQDDAEAEPAPGDGTRREIRIVRPGGESPEREIRIVHPGKGEKREFKVRVKRSDDPEDPDVHGEGPGTVLRLDGLERLGELGQLGELGNLDNLLSRAGRGRLGVRVESLSPDLAAAVGAPDEKGAFVLEVIKETPAAKAGLKAGDVITAVNDRKVADADDLVRALRDENGKVSVAVTRKGARRTVEAELEDAPRVMRFKRGEGSLGLGRLGDREQVDRLRTDDGTDRDGLRKDLDELRRQMRELRQQLEEIRRN